MACTSASVKTAGADAVPAGSGARAKVKSVT
jgi:hypothetical protein